MRISAAGGDAEILTTPDTARGEVDHVYPDFLPGDRAVLFAITKDQGIDNSQIALLDLETGEYRVLIQGGNHPRYSASGHIVYGVAGTLRAVRFDLASLEVTGNPVPVLDGVVTQESGSAGFNVATNGTLVYVSGVGYGVSNTLVWVGRDGREEPLDLAPGIYRDPVVSPDGTRVALSAAEGQTEAAWVWSLLSRTLTRLTFESGRQYSPLWTPDSTRIVYGSTVDGLYWRRADGTGAAEQLLETETNVSPFGWSADGQVASFVGWG